MFTLQCFVYITEVGVSEMLSDAEVSKKSLTRNSFIADKIG